MRKVLSRFVSGRGGEGDLETLLRHADKLVGGALGTPPGRTREVGVNLTPGTYVAVCPLPNLASGAPHFADGMVGTFTAE